MTYQRDEPAQVQDEAELDHTINTVSTPPVCLSVWVYSGYIMHHYKGIWGTCAPGRRGMHHSGAICTMEHKGDYIF